MTVTAVDWLDGLFRVQAENKLGELLEVMARSVVVASGIMQTPNIPAIAKSLPADIVQFHTSTYRNPAALPPGAVVIVGGGQSGCQIADELTGTGRDVYLCSSRVGRLPRRYRGQDVVDWWEDMGFMEVATGDLTDPAIKRARQPIISGVGRYCRSLSLQHLAQKDVSILGRLVEIADGKLRFDHTAGANIQFGDMLAERFKKEVDEYLANAGIEPTPLEVDPADEPDPEALCASPIQELDLLEAGVGSIIWTTGFTAKFDWLHLPVLDEVGMPEHENGIASVAGVYFVGFPWLRKRKSGIVHGIEDDAQFVYEHMAVHLNQAAAN